MLSALVRSLAPRVFIETGTHSLALTPDAHDAHSTAVACATLRMLVTALGGSGAASTSPAAAASTAASNSAAALDNCVVGAAGESQPLLPLLLRLYLTEAAAAGSSNMQSAASECALELLASVLCGASSVLQHRLRLELLERFVDCSTARLSGTVPPPPVPGTAWCAS